MHNPKTKIHRLKTWPKFFGAIVEGRKSFELRKNDRGFKVGDILVLDEFEPTTKTYTGASISKTVLYILTDAKFGLKKGYCVMGL